MSSNDYFKHFQSPKMPCFMKFPFIRQPLRGRTNPPTFRGKKNGLLGKNSYDLHFGPTSHLCTHPGLKPSSSLGKVSFCCLKSPSSRLWLLSPPCISRIWFRCFSSIRTSHPPLPIPSLGQLNSLQSHLLLKKQEKKRPSSLLSLSATFPQKWPAAVHSFPEFPPPCSCSHPCIDTCLRKCCTFSSLHPCVYPNFCCGYVSGIALFRNST